MRMVASAYFATTKAELVPGETPVVRYIAPSHKFQVWRSNIVNVTAQDLANSNNFVDVLNIDNDGLIDLNGSVTVRGSMMTSAIIFGDDSILTSSGNGAFNGGATTSPWDTNGDVIYYNDGWVGIGTAIPLSTLHVAGDLNVQEIKNSQNNVINFVNNALSNITQVSTNEISLSNITSTNSTIYLSNKSLSNINHAYLNSMYVNSIQPMSGVNVNFNTNNLDQIDTLNANNIYSSNIVYKNEPLMILIPETKVYTNTYSRTYKWIYRGAEERVRPLQDVFINCHLYTTCNSQQYLADSNFTYDIRLINVTHNVTLSYIGLSNNLPSLFTLPITNLPNSNIEIELQIKKGNFGEYVLLDSLGLGY